ncbi:GNAT family N-acetyltransferase [Pseudomonas sp. TNT2022 ID1025]|uniref:GNAT family N-acetyltransferase n=2 Tax=Pseudomonas rubra TaxID=2942627 RepID=A0ABT5PGI0_9PSED|nr:GNAT family N-acetyltransferase [Pseudomonas rubra]MDD1017320.1 GNAT family N-acetyltransferase [Pseudomonas rubra]MDD1039134.1 GNAT family N-acetyltransferase [Pseudomonas rubra]MDD1156951.1 GNAT family N-acetyltransferase [Pseudomonas rubra]
MHREMALKIEAAERDYLQSRVENLMQVEGNPYGARILMSATTRCLQVQASSSPMFNRVYGDQVTEPQAIVDLLTASLPAAVTPLIGTVSSLEQSPLLANRRLERLKGWAHVQLACAIEQAQLIPHGYAIEEVTPLTLSAFTDVHGQGFHSTPAQREMTQASFGVPDPNDSLKIFVIKEAGEVVAGAVMYLAANGVAYLGTAATRKTARGRGYHGALIAHRVEQARALGSTWVAATALANSQSRRNLQRAGLKVSHAQGLYRLAGN